MVATLVNLIIIVLVLGLIWYLITLLPVPAPARTVINVAFVVILIVFLLSLLTGHGDLPALR